MLDPDHVEAMARALHRLSCAPALTPDTHEWSGRHRAADRDKARFLLLSLQDAGLTVTVRES